MRGLAFWQERDARLSYAHPPLMNALAALPALPLSEPRIAEQPGWREHSTPRVATAYLREHYARARAQIERARLAMALVTLALLAYLYRALHSTRRAPPGPDATAPAEVPFAIVALALLAGNPTLLAHGQLDTTDLGAALFFLLIALEGQRYLGTTGFGPWLRHALALAGAAITKFNLLPFVLLLPAITVAAAAAARGRFRGLPGATRARRALIELAGTGALVVLAINAAYFFRDTGWTRHGLASAAETRDGAVRARLESGFFHFVPDRLPIPLPASYCAGVSHVGRHAADGHKSYFLGEVRHTGHPLYFPVLLLFKTPATYWLLMLGGLAAWVATRRRPCAPPAGPGGARSFALLWAMTGMYLLLLVTARLNLGVRHALPVVPALALLAARGFQQLWLLAAAMRPRRPLRGALLGGVALALTPPIWHYPDYLGYFNPLVGRARGHRVSIVGEDWGQDVGALAEHLRERGVTTVHYEEYALGGPQELRAAGLTVEPLRCRTAIDPAPGTRAHAALHRTSMLRQPGCYPWLARARPLATLRDHILLYEVEPAILPAAPAPPAAAPGDAASDGRDGTSDESSDER